MKTNTEDSVPRSIKQTIDQHEYSDNLRYIDHVSWHHTDDHLIKDLPIGPSVYITHRWTRWFWNGAINFQWTFWCIYTTFATHMSLIVADYFQQGHLWGHSLGLTCVLLKSPERPDSTCCHQRLPCGEPFCSWVPTNRVAFGFIINW